MASQTQWLKVSCKYVSNLTPKWQTKQTNKKCAVTFEWQDVAR